MITLIQLLCKISSVEEMWWLWEHWHGLDISTFTASNVLDTTEFRKKVFCLLRKSRYQYRYWILSTIPSLSLDTVIHWVYYTHYTVCVNASVLDQLGTNIFIHGRHVPKMMVSLSSLYFNQRAKHWCLQRFNTDSLYKGSYSSLCHNMCQLISHG